MRYICKDCCKILWEWIYTPLIKYWFMCELRAMYMGWIYIRICLSFFHYSICLTDTCVRWVLNKWSNSTFFETFSVVHHIVDARSSTDRRFQNAFYLNTCADTIDERCPARVEYCSETLPAKSIYKSRFRTNRLKRSTCHARNFGDLSSVTRRQKQLRKVNLF